jgi:hypothetical protein
VANSEIVRVVPGDTGKEVRYGVTFREFKEGSSDQISTYVTNKTAGK